MGPLRRARMPSSRAQLVFQWKGWSQQSVRCMGPQPSPSSPHTTADASGASCQARTVNGHVLWRAGFSSAHVSSVMQRAVREYGSCEWWEVSEEDVSV